MHFSYVKSYILRKWLNILSKFYKTMFTIEQSLLQRSIPLQPPGQPPHPASHPAPPATRPCLPPDPACHSTLPSTPPCLPAFPDSLARLLSHDCVASVATR